MGENWNGYTVASWIRLAYGNCSECGLGAPDFEVVLSKDGIPSVMRWHEVCLPRFVRDAVCDSHRS